MEEIYIWLLLVFFFGLFLGIAIKTLLYKIEYFNEPRHFEEKTCKEFGSEIIE